MSDLRAVVCTIVARNYLGQAEVLVSSLVRTNPELDVVTLVVDGRETDRATPGVGEVMLVSDLALAPEVVEPMVVMYSVMELSTALKAALLTRLLDRGHEVAIYLDPDIEVYDRLDDIVAAARAGRVVLTPHTLHAVPRDGCEVSESTIMHAGMYNLGFIAVPDGARGFLSWWHERLRTDAVVDFGAALFTDQRWVDWAPALAEVAILRDPGLNVAYWNIHERQLDRDPAGRVVVGDGRTPLRFFHFSGFDPERPWQLSHFTGERPRVLLAQSPVLGELCADHARALVEAGHLTRKVEPYGFARLPDGPLLSAHVRSVYRESMLGRLPFTAPPALAVSDPSSLTAWLTEPAPILPWGEMAPADLVIWRGSSDLQRLFPSPLVADCERFLAWLDDRPERADAYAELSLPAPGRPRVPAAERREDRWWVVPVGEPEPAFAVRAAAELVADALTAGGRDVDLGEPPSSDPADGSWRHRGGAPGVRPDNVLVCIDGDHLSEGRIHQALFGAGGQKVALWLVADGCLPSGSSFVVPGFDEHWALDERTVSALRELGAASVVRVALPHGRPGGRSGAAVRTRTEVLVVDGAADLRARAFEDVVADHLGRREGRDVRLDVVVAGRELVPRAVEVVEHAALGHAGIEVRTVADLDGLRAAIEGADAVLEPQDGPMRSLVTALARSEAAAVAASAGEGAQHEVCQDVAAAVRELDRRRAAQRRSHRRSARLRRALSLPRAVVRRVRSLGVGTVRGRER